MLGVPDKCLTVSAAENRTGHGIATYFANNGDRADVYLGVRFDGFDYYNNISNISALIGVKFNFFPSPLIRPLTNLYIYDPTTAQLLFVQVRIERTSSY